MAHFRLHHGNAIKNMSTEMDMFSRWNCNIMPTREFVENIKTRVLVDSILEKTNATVEVIWEFAMTAG